MSASDPMRTFSRIHLTTSGQTVWRLRYARRVEPRGGDRRSGGERVAIGITVGTDGVFAANVIKFQKMILLSYGFTFAVGLAVIILLIVAATAIWEKPRDDRKLKKLERERRRKNH